MRHLTNSLILLLFIISLSLGACSDKTVDEIKLKHTSSASRFINVNGLNVHYRDEGRGPVLVLVHGILSSLHTWEKWVNHLSGDFRVISFDLPGYGLTGPANFEYNNENYMRFLDNLFEALELERFNMAGSSLGGYFVWSYAKENPHKVDKIILLDSAAYPQKLPGAVSLFTLPVIGYISSNLTPRFIYEHYIREMYFDPDKVKKERFDQYYDLLMRSGNRSAVRKIFKVLDAQARIEPQGIADIKMPVLIMWGDEDKWVPFQQERWKTDMPQSQIIQYKNVGHLPMEEIPIKSARDAYLFLSGKMNKKDNNKESQ